MRKKLHSSWLLAWASVGVLAGVVTCLFVDGYFLNLSWLIAGLSLVAIALINRRVFIIILAIAGGLLIGLWRGSQDYQSQNVYQQFIGKEVVVSGVVSEDIALGKNGQQQIKIKEVVLDGQALSGQVWLSTTSDYEIKRSDRLEVSGRLSEGFGNFPAAMYRAEVVKITKVVHGDVGRELRDWFSASVRRVIDEPQASLGLGFLTGQHSTLPQSLENNLQILGLTHIVVASGYNLTILVRFSRGLLAGVSKYLATAFSFGLIFCFILVTGASPSMTRAGLITGLSLLAWYFGRRIHPLVLLPFAAAITALVNPTYLWGDLGWYLSFAAFGGVIIMAPLLMNYFWSKREVNPINRILVETLSAVILTAPIIAYSFGQFAPLALISNMLILPLIPLVMILTFITGVGSLVFGAVNLIGWPAQMLLSYMTFTTDKLANLPIAQGNISLSASQLTLTYAAIILGCVWLWRRTNHDFAQDSIIE